MLDSPNIYGLGERVYSFKLDTQSNDYPMFNRGKISFEKKNTKIKKKKNRI